MFQQNLMTPCWKCDTPPVRDFECQDALSCPLSQLSLRLYYLGFNTQLWSEPVHFPAKDKVQEDKINQMSVRGWAFVTHKSAIIKELNHLFWIITLLSKAMAAACLRRNLICLSKNTGRDTPAQRNHEKSVTADSPKATGEWGWVWLTAISYLWTLCLLLFSGVECWLSGTFVCTAIFL